MSFLITLGISVLSLLGWALGWVTFISYRPDYVPIAPSSALCFLILSASLLGYVRLPEKPQRRLIAGFSASLVILICSILLLAFVTKVTFNIEHLGLRPPAALFSFPVGHMSHITAVCFILASVGVLLLVFSQPGRQSYKDAAAFLAVLVMAVAFIILLGYLYGSPLLYGGNITPVALPTAVAFVFFSLGLITASGPHALPLKVFSGTSVRSRLLRVFLPTVVIFVLIYGLIYKTALSTASNPALISSVITIICAVIMGIVISNLARSIGNELDYANRERGENEAALRLSEATLRESEEKFRLLAHSAQDAIILINHEGNISFWNEAAERIFGYSQQEAIGKKCSVLVVPTRNHEAYENDFLKFVNTGMSGVFGKTSELKALKKDGTEFPVELSLSATYLQGKRAAVAIVRDISRRKAGEELIRSLAITDQLTGLYNRRGFLTLAEQQLKMMERSRKGLVLIFADLDELKKINDTWGHEAGDEALVQAARVLREVFRKTDIIARMGGDEFAVLAPDASQEYSTTVAKRLLDQLVLHNAGAGRDYNLSMSIGMAYCNPEQPSSLDEMLSCADSQMYEQKKVKRS